jgi:hypothetical protein
MFGTARSCDAVASIPGKLLATTFRPTRNVTVNKTKGADVVQIGLKGNSSLQLGASSTQVKNGMSSGARCRMPNEKPILTFRIS